MRGFGCNCPSCGAPERVSLFVLDSAAVRFSHRCAHCGEASALAAWSVQPLPQGDAEGDDSRLGRSRHRHDTSSVDRTSVAEAGIY